MKITKELLDRYHLNQCSDEERMAVQQWLNTPEADKEYPLPDSDHNALEDSMWLTIKSNVEAGNEGKIEEINSRTSVVPLWLSKLAAMLIVAFAALWIFWFVTQRRSAHMETSFQHTTEEQVKYVSVSTASGERKEYMLPDGSMVTLNAESELSYPALNLNTDTIRQVKLKGEAFFSVVSDTARPFIVYTDRSETRVLGTRFNVRDITHEPKAALTVSHGRVRFTARKSGQGQVYAVNQRGLTDGSSAPHKEHVYAARFTGWTEGKLVFENMPMSKVAGELNRWYGVKVTIDNADFANNHYTGSFTNKPVEQVIETISYSVGFRYKIENKQIRIY